ncbi:MAG: hypothetical protein GY810_16005 [Aureispira sp.]|nr:hypothetical protein [Aureispira sp.]
MDNHYQLSDKEFESAFKDCSLSSSLFSHEAHLRLAWLQIQANGVEEAINNVCNQIIKFVRYLGAEDKYHVTLTVAAVRIVNHFMESSKSDSFKGFISEFPVLNLDFKSLVEKHYSKDIFNSVVAKKEYIEPDVAF